MKLTGHETKYFFVDKINSRWKVTGKLGHVVQFAFISLINVLRETQAIIEFDTIGTGINTK